MADPRVESVSSLLMIEAALVDKRMWDEWLDLFAEDVEYWIPAWESETELTRDPANELSLIYYDSRKGLEDRVFRLRTGMSLASTPAARTCHNVFNIRPRFRNDGFSEVEAGWQAMSYRRGETTTFFGFYEYLLQPHGDSWKIRRKKVVLLNDLIPDVLDIYMV